MTKQVICTGPPGIIRQWAKRPDDEGNPGGGIPFLAELPPAELMPGTREYEGDAACHISYDGDLQELQDSFLPPMNVVAAQDYDLTYDYDEEGNIIGGPYGVEIPVPLSFIDFIPDIVTYDEDGNEVGRERPVPPVPMHTFLGGHQWVWADVGGTTIPGPRATKQQLIDYIVSQPNLGRNLSYAELEQFTKTQLLDIIDVP
jgi:hypothetical protein